MEYKLIKDKRRKKLVMTVENDGTVVIKGPKWTRKSTAEAFYRNNADWIASRKALLNENRQKFTVLTENDIKSLKQQAKDVMTGKTAYYSGLMGVKPDEVKITSATKKWGTCILRGGRYTICYSWRNMLLSDRCKDYIVVHELAHIKQMNHSPDFYSEVEKILPDYKDRVAELKKFTDYYIY